MINFKFAKKIDTKSLDQALENEPGVEATKKCNLNLDK